MSLFVFIFFKKIIILEFSLSYTSDTATFYRLSEIRVFLNGCKKINEVTKNC